MLPKPLLTAAVLGALSLPACTPTTPTGVPAADAPAASAAAASSAAPGVVECKTGMADATGLPASGMTVTSASGGKVVVQAPNGRRALCQLDAAGKLAKFDMM